MVADGSVADAEHLLAARQQVRHEVVDGTDRGRRDLLHATGHLAVHRVEHLALAGVDHGDDDAVSVPVRERQQVERD